MPAAEPHSKSTECTWQYKEADDVTEMAPPVPVKVSLSQVATVEGSCACLD